MCTVPKGVSLRSTCLQAVYARNYHYYFSHVCVLYISLFCFCCTVEQEFKKIYFSTGEVQQQLVGHFVYVITFLDDSKTENYDSFDKSCGTCIEKNNKEESVDKRKMGLTDMFVSLILHLNLHKAICSSVVAAASFRCSSLQIL